MRKVANLDRAKAIAIIQDEVLRRQRLGLIPESTAIRVDATGAYELQITVNPENPFEVEEYYRNYFFTIDEIVVVESIKRNNK